MEGLQPLCISPNLGGEREGLYVHLRARPNVHRVRVSLPKTGEGWGGVDDEEPLFAGASILQIPDFDFPLLEIILAPQRVLWQTVG